MDPTIPANSIIPGPFASTTASVPPAAYSFPQTLSVAGWNEYRLSSYGGCGASDAQAAVTLMIAAATSSAPTATPTGPPPVQGSRIIFDCNSTIKESIIIPSSAQNIAFEGEGHIVTVGVAGAASNFDLFKMNSTAGQVNAGLSWDNFTFAYPAAAPPPTPTPSPTPSPTSTATPAPTPTPTPTILPSPVPTTGSLFNIRSCNGCRWSNIYVSGVPFNLFILGNGDANQPSFTKSVISNVHTLSGGFVEGDAFQFPGPSGGIFINDFTISCDKYKTSSEGMVWNDTSSLAPDNNYDVFEISHGDFEQCGKGYDINLTHSTFDDYFMNDDIIDTARGGAALSFVASGSATIFRTRIFDIWAVGYGQGPVINYGSATSSSNYDSQIVGGHVENAYTPAPTVFPYTPIPAVGVLVGCNVQGVKITGLNAYHNYSGAVYIDGIDTSITASSFGTTTSGYAGTQNFAFVLGPHEYGTSVRGSDLRGNTLGVAQIFPGAGGVVTPTPAPTTTATVPPAPCNPVPTGTTDPDIVQDNNVSGYPVTTATPLLPTYAFLAPTGHTNIIFSGNKGDRNTAPVVAPSVTGSPCVVVAWQVNQLVVGCLDRVGNLTIAGTLQSSATFNPHLRTSSNTTGRVARRARLNAGMYRWKFPQGTFVRSPVCNGNEESRFGRSLSIVSINASEVLFRSSVLGHNRDMVDLNCSEDSNQQASMQPVSSPEVAPPDSMDF